MISEAEMVARRFSEDEKRRARLMNQQENSKYTVEELEELFGSDDVWTTVELQEHFMVHSFEAPFVHVTRVIDGRVGTVEFQASPRVYFYFKPRYGDK